MTCSTDNFGGNPENSPHVTSQVIYPRWDNCNFKTSKPSDVHILKMTKFLVLLRKESDGFLPYKALNCSTKSTVKKLTSDNLIVGGEMGAMYSD